MRKVVIVLLSLALLLACQLGSTVLAQTDSVAQGTGELKPAAQIEAPPAGYRLQKEDVMRISVWGEPNLSTEQVVDPQGYISMQLLGPVFAEGLTQQALTDVISSGLKKYLREPKVKVELMRFRQPKVHVFGFVGRPGVYEFKSGDRVMEAVAKAGSYLESADLHNARLTRAGKDIPLDLDKLFYAQDLSQNLELQDGDAIFLPEDTISKYSVAGEVMRQGQFRWKKDLRVWDAVSTAGGPTERASLKSTYILRGDMSNPQRIHVDMDKFMKKADASQNLELQPGDVVYVSETTKPNWTKISSILSTLVNSTYLFRLWGR